MFGKRCWSWVQDGAKIRIEGAIVSLDVTSGTRRHSAAAVCLGGPLASSTADVAAPVVHAVASAGDVRQQGHVTTATAHRSAAAGPAVVRTTFPIQHHKLTVIQF